MTNNRVWRLSTGYSPPTLGVVASFLLISTAAMTKAGEHRIAGVWWMGFGESFTVTQPRLNSCPLITLAHSCSVSSPPQSHWWPAHAGSFNSWSQPWWASRSMYLYLLDNMHCHPMCNLEWAGWYRWRWLTAESYPCCRLGGEIFSGEEASLCTINVTKFNLITVVCLLLPLGSKTKYIGAYINMP